MKPQSRPNESLKKYKERVVDKISPTFCGTRWYNATLWLNSGIITSCCHIMPRQIKEEELKNSFRALVNTPHDKEMRKKMLRDERPDECAFCWRIEDAGGISDRIYRTVVYTEDELSKFSTMTGDEDIDLKVLEIAFDNNCNFACSYCSAAFSTTWQTDIKVKGDYNLITDNSKNNATMGNSMHYGQKNKDNPYITAFWKWWENDLNKTLTQLRVTGGEPTMSKEFWRLIDWFLAHPACNTELRVNTNLGTKPEFTNKLIDVSNIVKNVGISTSNEAYGEQAEYIRDGLDWQLWSSNIFNLLKYGKIDHIIVTSTITAMSVTTILRLLDWLIHLRIIFPGKISSYINVLQWPDYQAVHVLPKYLRDIIANDLITWFGKNKTKLYDNEIQGVKSLINFIKNNNVDKFRNIANRTLDFKSFFSQYDKRRGKNFSKTFPELAEWYEAIPLSGDIETNKYIKELDLVIPSKTTINFTNT